jgi:chorismate mutase
MGNIAIIKIKSKNMTELKRHEQEKEVLEEMIEWLNKRIIEMQGKAPAYEDMKESLKWELKTVNERIENYKLMDKKFF